MSIILDLDSKKFNINFINSDEELVYLKVEITSGNFSGVTNFYISKNQLSQKLQEIKIINSKLEGSWKIQDSIYDSYILIEMLEYGKLKISGKLTNNDEENILNFKYLSDQTMLSKLISVLQNIIKMCN